MRNLTLVLLAATSLATPALGQVSPQAQQQLDLLTQQQLDRQRSIALENQLNALDARVQSERRLQDFQAAAPPAYARRAPGEGATPGAGYAAIPDAVLADSNARVRAVTQNRR
ncbi:hypothetical protein [Phenylobacterium sp.]|jgi:hypothetical protein|uniref:hypothetical protein n=1 Tax=Phenylobacterium sp. TaxID=1871053 RepID=UPI0035B45A88